MAKIALFSDSPYATTGLGRMVRYFLKMFPEHEWHIYGVNHPHFFLTGMNKFPHTPDQDEFPSPEQLVTPSERLKQPYGAQGFVTFIQKVQPDKVITFLDFNNIIEIAEQLKQLSITEDFEWIHYMNVDRYDYAEEEFPTLDMPDRIVTSSKFGQKQLRAQGFDGVDTAIWHPIDESEFPKINRQQIRSFKKDYYGKENKDKLIIGSVNRVFARKDPVRLMKSFIDFQKENDNSILYFHGSPISYEGVDMRIIARILKSEGSSIMFRPPNYTETLGVSQEDLNKIYRSLDVFATASMGEGFGFSTVEALLTETPIVAPDNTTFKELIGDNGYVVPLSDWVFVYGQYSTPWQIVDAVEFTKTLKHVSENMEEAKEKAKAGRKWVLKNLSLDNIKKQWALILNS